MGKANPILHISKVFFDKLLLTIALAYFVHSDFLSFCELLTEPSIVLYVFPPQFEYGALYHNPSCPL